ncbi:IMPACT family protein [Ornithinimicrobium panacihumi]|uniref:IMPACT family protein n=1 Tax=Ornithinimicrobium panacihumi TaxID=2008449 RepID=UPI003F8AE83F
MSTAYRTLAGPVVASIEEKRSVFECWLRPVEDEAAARAVVDEARGTHWDARHHCSAFVLGPDGAVRRSNDDGEPAGTAGAPMLEALAHADLTDVVAVVTRWFGGTLLGTGGLARAYGDAVRAAVEQAVEDGLVLTRVLARQLEVRAGHDLAGRLEHDLRGRGVEVVGADYGAEVTFTLRVPLALAEDVDGLLGELTAGQAVVVPGSEADTWVDGDHGPPSPD